MSKSKKVRLEEALAEVQNIKSRLNNLEDILKVLIEEYAPSIRAEADYFFTPNL
jgi:hypothetical protein